MRNPLKHLGLAAVVASILAGSAGIGLLVNPSAAKAETVYRCGPDFKQYSQQPCDGGRALEVDDHRSADQIEQGKDAARHHAKAAHDIEQNLKEMNRHPPTFGSLSPRPAASAPRNADKTKGKRRRKTHRPSPDDKSAEFTAVDPASLHKKHATAQPN